MRAKGLCILMAVLMGCAVGVTTHYDKDGNTISKEPHFRVMQIPIVPDHATAQSTVGVGFSLRFTDMGGAITPKLDLGYFRHAIGIDPVLSEGQKLGGVAIVTSADVTGEGIRDEVDFGEAALVEHFQGDSSPSMFEMVIGELQGMQENANEADKAKYQATIDFMRGIMGGQ